MNLKGGRGCGGGGCSVKGVALRSAETLRILSAKGMFHRRFLSGLFFSFSKTTPPPPPPPPLCSLMQNTRSGFSENGTSSPVNRESYWLPNIRCGVTRLVCLYPGNSSLLLAVIIRPPKTEKNQKKKKN